MITGLLEAPIVAATELVLVADGNSRAGRSARAKAQLRDRFGRFIEMGAGVRFKFKGAGAAGGGTWFHGTVVDQEPETGRVSVKLDDGRTVSVPASKLETTKATLKRLLPGAQPAEEDIVLPSDFRVAPQGNEIGGAFGITISDTGVPNKLYHAAPAEAAAGILRDGLIVGSKKGDPDFGVHMAASPLTVNFIEDLYELPPGSAVLFEIDTRGLDLQVGMDGDGTWQTDGLPVSVDHVRQVPHPQIHDGQLRYPSQEAHGKRTAAEAIAATIRFSRSSDNTNPDWRELQAAEYGLDLYDPDVRPLIGALQKLQTSIGADYSKQIETLSELERRVPTGSQRDRYQTQNSYSPRYDVLSAEPPVQADSWPRLPEKAAESWPQLPQSPESSVQDIIAPAPIPVGTAVKSRRDGAVGTVVGLDKNPDYVRVKTADGKVKVRSVKTLEVTDGASESATPEPAPAQEPAPAVRVTTAVPPPTNAAQQDADMGLQPFGDPGYSDNRLLDMYRERRLNVPEPTLTKNVLAALRKRDPGLKLAAIDKKTGITLTRTPSGRYVTFDYRSEVTMPVTGDGVPDWALSRWAPIVQAVEAGTPVGSGSWFSVDVVSGPDAGAQVVAA